MSTYLVHYSLRGNVLAFGGLRDFDGGLGRVGRQREWALRMMNELEYHEYSVFVTLTFREAPYQISKRDMQLFLKRLRKELYPRKIKYYACGEYGEKRDRPHYHCIIFGVSGFGQDKDAIERAWPAGFIYTGSVTYESCRYVAKYIQKSMEKSSRSGWLIDNLLSSCSPRVSARSLLLKIRPELRRN